MEPQLRSSDRAGGTPDGFPAGQAFQMLADACCRLAWWSADGFLARRGRCATGASHDVMSEKALDREAGASPRLGADEAPSDILTTTTNRSGLAGGIHGCSISARASCRRCRGPQGV